MDYSSKIGKDRSVGCGKQCLLVWSCVEEGGWSCHEKGIRFGGRRSKEEREAMEEAD